MDELNDCSPSPQRVQTFRLLSKKKKKNSTTSDSNSSVVFETKF